MNVKIITLPFDPTRNVFDDDTINQFTINKHIISMNSQFFYHNNQPYWSVFIEYNVDVELTPQEDLKSSLDQPGLLFYKRLQEWRKIKADEHKIPVFIIATNKQMIKKALKISSSFIMFDCSRIKHQAFTLPTIHSFLNHDYTEADEEDEIKTL